MRQKTSLFCLLFLITTAHAEIIDRIMAVVENRIITLSDLRGERTIRTVLGEPASEDDSILLRELIERTLIMNQLNEFPGVEIADQEIDGVMRQIPGGHTVPQSTLREAIRMRLRIAEFVDVRFRQFIRVTEEDSRKYYEEIFVPEVRARGGAVPSLEDVAVEIRKNVVEEKLDHDIDIWLESVRRRSSVEIYQ